MKPHPRSGSKHDASLAPVPNLALAMQSFKENNLDAASMICKEILQEDEHNANALELLSVIEAKLEHNLEATHLMRLRSAMPSATDGALSNLSRMLNLNNETVQAAAVIGQRQGTPQSTSHLEATKPTLAKEKLDGKTEINQETLIQNESVDTLIDQASQFMLTQHYEEAILLLRRALMLRPSHLKAVSMAGKLSWQMNEYKQAARYYETAVKIQPDNRLNWLNLGTIFLQLENYEGALATIDRQHQLEPDHPSTHGLHALIHMARNEFDQAENLFKKALGNVSSLSKAQINDIKNNYATGLIRKMDYVAAATILREICEEQGKNAGHLSNYAFSLRLQNQFEEARLQYKQAMRYQPNNADIHFAHGLTLLSMGALRLGFEEYEWRLNTQAMRNKDYTIYANNPKKHLRRASQIIDRDLTIYSEQGYGDMLQFSRFIPIIAKFAKSVTFYIQDRKFEINTLIHNFPKNVSYCFHPDPIPKYDFHVPLMSLAHVLNVDLESLPPPTPFKAPKPDVQKWNRWLVSNDLRRDMFQGLTQFSNSDVSKHAKNRPLIGICLHGRPTHNLDKQRSASISAIAPLLDVDTNYILLEPAISQEDQAFIKEHPQYHIVHNPDAMENFTSSAALIQNLDYVVTVDTAVAHLAAGLGVPTAILLAKSGDWRWEIQSSVSAWYPDSVYLFRQIKLGDWSDPITSLNLHLQRYFSKTQT
ncbi:MAG: tetratricopeptide repeat protein [Alphaproteobacteria bacterium]